jgi:hypothetical protein
MSGEAAFGPESTQRLAEHLGIALLIEDLDPGPPVRIVATAILDGAQSGLEGSGDTEEDAWRELGRAVIAWRRDDPRNVRFYAGGF